MHRVAGWSIRHNCVPGTPPRAVSGVPDAAPGSVPAAAAVSDADADAGIVGTWWSRKHRPGISMLLPIGSDQTTVRRMPWVSFSIIALCVVVFILILIAPGDQGAIVEAELRAVMYYVERPYLELDPGLKGYLYYSLRQIGDDDPVPPPDPARLLVEQRELDRLVDGYFAARDSLPFWRWGLVPADMEIGDLVTHTFIHAGLLHLIGNLFIFYLVGPAMEDVWGRPLFAVFYVLSGAVAALVFVARYPDLMEPLIGASGAVAGVMGAFAIRYWNSRITFFYFVWMIRMYQGTFTAPAGLMLGLWAAGELAFAMGLWAFVSIADLGNVGFLAHVGGFVFGVGFAYLVAALKIEERFVDPVVERREIVHEADAVEACLELAEQGRWDEAMAGLEEVLDHCPGDADAAAALWNTAVRSGGAERGIPGVVPALETAARAGEPGLIAQIWPELLVRFPEVEIDLRTAARIAELLAREGMDGDVETTLNWLAVRVDDSTPEAMLVRLARLSHATAVPAPFASLALSRPDLDPGLKTELQSFSGLSA
jgi:membrane associated rhomboid family serine protease